MTRGFLNSFVLARKEISSLLRDTTLIFFLLYCFSFLVYTEATGVKTEVNNASIGIIDLDHSELSRRIAMAFQPPFFKEVEWIESSKQYESLRKGEFIFVLYIKSGFERDLLSGLRPDLEVDIDATSIAHAGIGASYIEHILFDEIQDFLNDQPIEDRFPVNFITRALYNSNLESVRYQAVMSLVEQITLITLLLVGTAVIRESERGTLEHLMVMPIAVSEIALSKIAASTFFVLAGASFCLIFIIEMVLEVPLNGSGILFFISTYLYMLVISALAIYLATISKTMPQYGLLSTPVFLVLMLLSGAYSPIESMPALFQKILVVSPTLQYVKITQGIYFRGAGIDILYPQLIGLALFGVTSMIIALQRFKKHLVSYH